MKIIFTTLLLLLALTPLPASASKEIGEGYAKPTFRELYQTVVANGGMDINDTKVSDEYGRLAYCDLYRDHFKDDVAWNKIRGEIVSRIVEKKEYYRVLYETSGVFKLDRYNFDGQYFPLTPDTAMKNVGSIVLFSQDDFRPYCGLSLAPLLFPPDVNMLLSQPLTLDRLRIPVADVQRVLAVMDKAKNPERWVYGRIRMRITEVPGLVIANDKPLRAELKGGVTAIDFFLDREMTEPVGGAQPLK